MKARLVVVAASVISSAACTSSPPAERAPAAGQAANKSSLLFVAEAKRGMLQMGVKNAPDMLILFDANRETTWFTDRPRRDAGTIATQGLVNHWAAGDESFRKDPPNAALVLRDSSGKSEVYAMEIWNPQYDAGSGTLAYDIRELDSGVPVTAGHAPAHRAREAPSRFSDATLFIDPSEAVCQMLYGESCGVAVCDPLAVFVFNRAQCLAEANGTAPPPTPPPTCAAGSTPENPGNGWVCVA